MKKIVKLIEFRNKIDEVLRGIVTVPEHSNGRGTIFLQGLERNATVEKKFRRLSDALAEKGISSLRFDASGCGLSEGDFSRMTLEKRGQELMAALDAFKKECRVSKISFVGHSLGICPIAPLMEKLDPMIDKMVFIAPALNQMQLLRYYYAIDRMAVENPGLEITWENYSQYVDEDNFLSHCRSGQTLKENLLRPPYFLEAKNLDYSASFDGIKDKILHVHGDHDKKVPLQSLNTEFPHKLIVAGGDHDLERPEMWEQWFSPAVDFLAW